MDPARRFRSKAALFFAALASLAGCEHTTPAGQSGTSPSQSPAPAKTEARWLDAFAAYPGAKPLCNQHVAGRDMHIDWTSYTTADEPARVQGFYEKNLGAAAIEREHGFALRVGENLVLDVVAAGGAHPTCDKAPASSDKTVIVVSQAIH